ncbi:MAG: transcriptional activator of acetoin/glycerol metabolism [Proteobacteria bacterium]|nr:transcriptional activator of acetoin/glycerol metabolism [Pseudomonadota bacterium]
MTLIQKSGRAVLRRARELFLERGEVPVAYMVNNLLARSWRRSANAGLTPEGRLPDVGRLEGHQLAQATERQHDLLTHARPVMEYLYSQTRNSESMVILSDDRGIILQTYGDADFLHRAERIALAPGFSWSERYRGTNGIGTVLEESVPLSVIGGEHFLERNGFLSCSAAPVKGPDGRLLGVLDISGDERHYHPHTFSLVRTAAQMMENRLFEASHGHHLRIHFHLLAEGIGTFDEGVAALSEEGTIIGANQAGFSLLRLAPADLGITPLSHVLQVRLEDLLDWCRRRSGEPCLVSRNDGSRLFVRIEAGQGKPTSAPVPPPERRKDALSALDTGDERLATAIDKARKLIGKPINLLLQGEAGVGKEYFARAFHSAGPRRAAPFVSINCAAVQPNLLEAELFGFAPTLCRDGMPGRLREAHGGTLFVDEIGDLPLPLQTRLLGVLLDKQLTPMGGEAEPVDFVLICATHCNLKAEIESSRFSVDLYYQINGITLLLPPLRQRQDFQALLARLLDELAPNRGISLEPAVAMAFASYPWPGNISQLANALRAACTLLDGNETRIGWQHLPDDLVEELRWQPSPAASAAGEATENLRELSQATISRAIALSHGNMTEAARRLGISRNTLYRRLRTIQAGDEAKTESTE